MKSGSKRHFAPVSRRAFVGALVGAAFFASAAEAQVPAGYPADYAKIIEDAKKEGSVKVYATTDAKAASPLIKDFEALYGIKVEYNDLNSTELYNRFIAESASSSGTADVTWSSAPDLQVKLVADGLAVAYASPEVDKLPKWAVFNNQAYGTTYEPMVIVYNKSQMPAGDTFTDHTSLAKLLTAKADVYKGKVTAYDPERSGVGFLMMNRDVVADPKVWDLFNAFGKAESKYYTSAGAMIEKVGSGEHLIAYNIFASYAALQTKKNPNLGVIYPSDFTLVATRVAFIPTKANHPNAGKLFLDYLLSKRGQTIVAKAELFSIRDDVEGAATAKAVNEKIGATARPIPVSNELLGTLEQSKRLEFLNKWQASQKK
ncbi:MAG: ABC transporter substrate-binding protein [Beijerinckiaceae bacterium]|nr:ABC transporter substrate-binding protein [Beijerinckiaceae bacterium]